MSALRLHGVPSSIRARLGPSLAEPAPADRAALAAAEGMLDGRAWLVAPRSVEGLPSLDAEPDGNRGAILQHAPFEAFGHAMRIAIKGVGARAPMYGTSPLGFDHGAAFGDLREGALLGAITRDAWMDEASYGGQGLEGASHALALTRDVLAGAFGDALRSPLLLAPTFAIVDVPDAEIRSVFHYRKRLGPVVQEQRLLPSAIRLFHQSSIALARHPEEALAALGIEGPAALSMAIERFLASGLALLTIGARSVRVRDGLLELLDYDDAWLDKDSVVAADGSLVFADLEALVWTPVAHVSEPRAHDAVRERIARQLARNAYELLYGLDVLLDVEERWTGATRDARQRRLLLARRTERALLSDPAVEVLRSDDAVDLELPLAPLAARVRLRWLDL